MFTGIRGACALVSGCGLQPTRCRCLFVTTGGVFPANDCNRLWTVEPEWELDLEACEGERVNWVEA